MPERMAEVTYTCARCGKSFESDWTDEEAQAEAAEKFDAEELEDAAVVCDDCYKTMGLED